MRMRDNTMVIKPIEGFFLFFVVAITVGLLAGPYYPYAILPGITIVLLLLLIKSPELGYYIIVFLIPFEVYRTVSSSYQFLTISKFVGFLVVIITSLYLLLQKRIPYNLKSNLWLWFMIFFLINSISTLISDYPLTALSDLISILIAYIFFALTLIFISHRGFSRTLPSIIILSIVISSVLSIIGYLYNIEPLAMDLESLKRAKGPANNPNIFSSMILFSLPLLVHWFFSSRGFLKRISAVALFLLNVTAIIVTYSRGGAIVLTVVLVLLSIEHVRRLRPRYFGFITSLFLILIAVTLIFIPASYWQRQRSVTYTQTDPAVMERISYLPFAWRIFKKDPIIGSGPGTFKEKYATSTYSLQFRKETDLLSDYKRYAHNSYIEVLVGTGVLGIVVFFIILLLTFKNFNLAKRNFLINGKKEMASLVGAYRLSFISMLIYFLISSNNYSKYFWISLGLSQVALRLSQDISEQKRSLTP